MIIVMIMIRLMSMMMMKMMMILTVMMMYVSKDKLSHRTCKVSGSDDSHRDEATTPSSKPDQSFSPLRSTYDSMT